MSEEKDKCETCEHKSDSSNEYCGACGGGVESNWKEAGWRKDEKIKSLESRLSQAEAEVKRLAEVRDGYEKQLTANADWDTKYNAAKKISDIEERLSHLMDVAGKMADTLETISFGKDGDPREWTYEDLDKLIREMVRLAKSGIAEWDGIKDGGKCVEGCMCKKHWKQ